MTSDSCLPAVVFRPSRGLPFVVLGLFLVSAVGQAGPEKVRFDTDLGPVTMNHRLHQRSWAENCSVCHHLDEKGQKKPCGDCHKGRAEAEEKGGAPAYFEVKMELCRGCHLKRREADSASKAPIHCEECHDIKAKAGG